MASFANNNAVWRLSLDSRRLADRQLKSTCEAFIDYCGDFLIGPIRVYLAKVIFNKFPSSVLIL